MNTLVYIFVPNEFVIGQVVLKLLIKRLAVAMVNKTVTISRLLITYTTAVSIGPPQEQAGCDRS
jgi:hypothetical protein